MRENIGIYRGKRIDTGAWEEGYLLGLQDRLTGKDFFFIVGEVGEYHIDPETVGEYTGLTDKNGTKIFEGDIVKFKHGDEFDETIYYRNYAVEFINTYVTYGLRLRNGSIHFPFKKATALQHEAEVIGNIYDNPELLNV
jgi:uncharacterized phage protein (TIGR01671 family)